MHHSLFLQMIPNNSLSLFFYHFRTNHFSFTSFSYMPSFANSKKKYLKITVALFVPFNQFVRQCFLNFSGTLSFSENEFQRELIFICNTLIRQTGYWLHLIEWKCKTRTKHCCSKSYGGSSWSTESFTGWKDLRARQCQQRKEVKWKHSFSESIFSLETQGFCWLAHFLCTFH